VIGTSAGGVPISVMVPVMSAAREMDVAAKTPIKQANEKTFTVKKVIIGEMRVKQFVKFFTSKQT
jgi:hypothetical protein